MSPHIYFALGRWRCVQVPNRIGARLGAGSTPLEAFTEWAAGPPTWLELYRECRQLLGISTAGLDSQFTSG